MKNVTVGTSAIVTVVLSLALAGCGSGDGSSSQSGNSLSSAPSTTKAPYAQSIPDYIKQNGITETSVKRGDPGSPAVNFPIPPGWADLGPATAAWAFAGIKFVGDPAMATNPPTIVAVLSKLSGNVEPAKILEFAPGEMKNLPGYEGDATGSVGKLGGFDAVQIGGNYMKEGVKRAVAQKTVVIPASDGVFVLQLNADGSDEQKRVLMDATTLIDEKTTIVPAQ